MKTPLKNFTLPEGEHIVRLENKAFGASWEGRVSVKAERLLKKDVLLMKSQ